MEMEMKMKDIKTGEVFCIEGTKSYPKLKLDIGYVDMRDEIRNTHDLDCDCDLMTEEEVKKEFKKYNLDTDDIKTMKEVLMEKYN